MENLNANQKAALAKVNATEDGKYHSAAYWGVNASTLTSLFNKGLVSRQSAYRYGYTYVKFAKKA